MCGIVGVYHFATTPPVEFETVERMTRTLEHRGPDDHGVFLEPNRRLGLGHQRLSIIDLEHGHQPMSDGSGAAVIAFDGQIYNLRELRQDLERRGAQFRTKSDAEVILALYLIDGEDGFSRLNGIFAFAIWDGAKQRLICARDPLGVRPFYFFRQGGRLLFGSEVKALLEHPEVPRAIDPDALASCLCFHYVPSPRTLFLSIEKLNPGHCLIANAKGIEVLRFWAPTPRIDRRIAFPDAMSLYRRKLEAAVQRQMVSDVPIGVMLTSGVDSGVIAAIMAESSSQRRVQSFSVGFEGLEHSSSELRDAARTAELLDLDHHQMSVAEKDFDRFFNDYLWHQEEPTGDASAAEIYWVAKLARQRVKVLLSAQAAGQPLAAYDRYKGEHYSRGLRQLPKGIREALQQAAPLVLPQQEKLRRSLEALGEMDTAARFLKIVAFFGPQLQGALWRTAPAGSTARALIAEIDERRKPAAQLDGLSQLLYVDARMSLPDDILTVTDRMSMAVGLELRLPFLDVDLVEFLETLPPSYKLRLFRGAHIHQSAAARWLPDELIKRKRPRVAHPIEARVKREMIAGLDRLRSRPDSLCRTYFNSPWVEQLLRAERQGTADWSRQLSLLGALELWNERFIARSAN